MGAKENIAGADKKFPFFGLRVQWNDDGTKKKNCARTEYFYGHLYLARIFIVWKSGVAGSRNKMKWNVFCSFFFCSPLFVGICGGKGKKSVYKTKKKKKTGTQTYRPSLCMFATHLGVLTTCGATTWGKQCIDSCEREKKKCSLILGRAQKRECVAIFALEHCKS